MKRMQNVFHLLNSPGQNKIHPVPYVESNFHPQEGRGSPVKKGSGESSPGQVFLCPAGRGDAHPWEALAARAFCSPVLFLFLE